METGVLIRVCVGAFFIVYGLIFVAIEKLSGMTISDYKDQINGVLNGFVCMMVGVFLASINLTQGIYNLVMVLLIWIIERYLLKKYLDSKESKFVGREGIAVEEIKLKSKGYIKLNDKKIKVRSQNEYIPKGSKVKIYGLDGATLLIDIK